MISRTFLTAGFQVLAALLLIAGCAADPSPPHEPAGNPKAPELDSADHADDADGSRRESIEALTRKTSEYARQMEQWSAAPPGARPDEASLHPERDDELESQRVRSGGEPGQTISSGHSITQADLPARRDRAGSDPTSVRPALSWADKLIHDTTEPDILPEQIDHHVPREPSSAGDGLEARLARRIEEAPADLAAHLDYQLLRFLQDEQVPQLNAIADLSAEDRELLATLLDALSNFRDGVRSDPDQRVSQKVRPMLEMAQRLRGQTELTLPTLALCRRVDGFGVYEPIEPAEFAAGRRHPVIVYCEVANFTSHLNDEQRWETRLSQELVLYTESGLSVWEEKSHAITDQSRNRRRDFFIVQMVELPANLTAGQYVLKVSVMDEQSDRVAETTTPVRIVSR